MGGGGGEEKFYNLRFARGATHLLVGPSASGKTHRCCTILRHKDSLIEDGDRIRNVVFFYAAWQPIYEELRRDGIVTKFVKKKPSTNEFVKLVEDFRDEGGSCCVIDDYMTEIDKDLVDIVTVQSRHYNVSTFILFQSLFPPNRLARQISLNVKYLHIHKNPRENQQIATLASQLSPGNTRWIVAAYHAATREPHQCLLIDLTQDVDERLRYRTRYLPHEMPMLVYMAEGDVEEV